jgi:serine/threonine protein kinase
LPVPHLAATSPLALKTTITTFSQKHRISPTDYTQAQQTLPDHKYEICQEIDSGGFATVVTAFNQQYQQEFAVKISRLCPSYSAESNALQSLYHSGTIRLYDAFDDSLFGYLVLQLCLGGTLEDRLKTRGPLNLRDFREIGIQLLEAIGVILVGLLI